MGNSQANSRSTATATNSNSSRCPVSSSTKNPTGATDSQGQHPDPVSQNGGGGGCPIKHGKAINPANNMPLVPDQSQDTSASSLSTSRVQSTIPKSGAEMWSYPSPQMFFNALVRKGKAEDVEVSEMETVVAVHNNMNEKSWKDVLEWEALHAQDCAQPTLARFLGRPDDLTPKAWLKHYVLGYPRPFDRHDWFVDRCGKKVRYVIDFYFDEEMNKQDSTPSLHDAHSIKSIQIDARPAIDDLESFVDRVKFPLLKSFGWPETGVQPSQVQPGVGSEKDESSGILEAIGEMSKEDVAICGGVIKSKCKPCFEKVDTCSSEESCARESLALTLCMASVVCPDQAKKLQEDPSLESAHDEVAACLQTFEKRAYEVSG